MYESGCRDDEDNIVFKGWARMAVPIQQFSIIEVRKPRVGENKPASVEADIVIDTKGMPAALSRTCSPITSKAQIQVKQLWKPQKLKVLVRFATFLPLPELRHAQTKPRLAS